MARLLQPSLASQDALHATEKSSTHGAGERMLASPEWHHLLTQLKSEP